MAVKNFKELVVWQKSMELTLIIYHLVKHFPKEEMYALTSQICRAAVSIPSNIAEGQGRQSKAEFLNFLSIANGSLAEVETQLLIAIKLGYIQEADAQYAQDLIIQIGKMATYREYDIFDMDDLIQQIMLSVQSKEEALATVNQLIMEKKEHWDLYKLVVRKIEILKELGKTAEVETTISEFLYLPEIRRQEIAKLLEGKCYEKAIGMLNEGIVIAERAGELGIVGEWQEQLLSIYEEMHDVAKIIEMCRLLFIHTDGSLGYYHKLKSLVPSMDWKEYLNALMQETTFYDYWGTGNNKAEIYIEEKDYDKLFGYLSALEYRRLDALLQYASHLNATHSSQILPLFTDDLRTYAEKNLGRNHYEYIARVLRGMRKLNGGKEVVKQLVEEFRVLYKRRPAMMQELGEF